MKNALFALTLALALFSNLNSALACSPPLPSGKQNSDLSYALSSDAYSDALQEIVNADLSVSLKSITFEKGIQVLLSNGCKIQLKVRYAPPKGLKGKPSPGMCPQFDRVEAETTCPSPVPAETP